jgi:hypothetical protein
MQIITTADKNVKYPNTIKYPKLPMLQPIAVVSFKPGAQRLSPLNKRFENLCHTIAPYFVLFLSTCRKHENSRDQGAIERFRNPQEAG